MWFEIDALEDPPQPLKLLATKSGEPFIFHFESYVCVSVSCNFDCFSHTPEAFVTTPPSYCDGEPDLFSVSLYSSLFIIIEKEKDDLVRENSFN